MTEPDTTALREVMQQYPDLTIDGLGGDHRPDLERRRHDLVEARISLNAPWHGCGWCRRSSSRDAPRTT
jgi:hypothetical protein